MGLTKVERVTELTSLVQIGSQGTCAELLPVFGAKAQRK